MRKLFLFLPIYLIFFTGCFQEKKEIKFFGNVDVRTVSLAFRVSGRLDTLNFDEGQKLKKGDIIGFVGNTGKTSGPHLHYAILKKGSFVNPESYFNY